MDMLEELPDWKEITKRINQMEDLIRLGLVAASNLGVRPDAEIIFVARGSHAHVCKIIRYEDELRSVYEWETIALKPIRIGNLHTMIGYSKKCNQLAVRILSETDKTEKVERL